MSKFIHELKKRGLLQNLVLGTEMRLSQGCVRGYVGFDPTAISLGVGNLVPVFLLKHLQQAGHAPVIVLGGATGMIGDPSGKSAERQFLDPDTLQRNKEAIRQQLSLFLDFSGPQGAIILDNYEWHQDTSVLTFLRDAGKHITVNYMLAKESVKNRMETGLSYTEFSYALLQAYDFYYLYKHHQVVLQMGGDDQWGNITTGVEFIRKKLGTQVYGLTAPLITQADGRKFGKTEQGNIWLDPQLTSPYKFYQFWLNCTDEDALNLIKKMTLYPLEEIAEYARHHALAPHKRIVQKALARFLTTMVHGTAAYEQAVHSGDVLFGEATAEGLYTLDEATLLNACAGLPQVTAPSSSADLSLAEYLSVTTGYAIFDSKSKARAMLEGGGVSVNKIKATRDSQLSDFQWICDRYLLVQKGKKHYYLVRKNYE